MIKANELRIGNYLQFKEHIATVTIINRMGGEVEWFTWRNEDWYRSYIPFWEGHEDVNYIPLTEEWLLKFGFEKKEKMQFGGLKYIYSNGCFELNEAFQVLFANGRKLIQYVHQLQNLYFALTGTELTIKESVK